MSNKLRIKHLTENNTRESIPGEMIISNVTGHISVRDNYFVNSSTKDILGRINALDQLCKYLSDIDDMYSVVTDYNYEFSVYNNIDLDSENFDNNYNIAEANYLKDCKETPAIDLSNDLLKLKDDIMGDEGIIESRISALAKLSEVEDLLSETIMLYEKLDGLRQYVLEQQFIFDKYLEELKEDFEVSEVNYEELYDRYTIFTKYIESKYNSLTREFDNVEIIRDGGVLNNG